jgi:transketolase
MVTSADLDPDLLSIDTIRGQVPRSSSRAVVGMHTFGASAPLEELLTTFGFTPDRVADVARECATATKEIV